MKSTKAGPTIHSKDTYQIVAKILHFALQRREIKGKPLFTKENSSTVLTEQTDPVR